MAARSPLADRELTREFLYRLSPQLRELLTCDFEAENRALRADASSAYTTGLQAYNRAYVARGADPTGPYVPYEPWPVWNANSQLNADLREAAHVASLTRVPAAVEHPKPATDAERRVNDMIDDLTERRVSQPDRSRLRDALDKADKPREGKEGRDDALRGAIGRLNR
jgi:hypothetical protein